MYDISIRMKDPATGIEHSIELTQPVQQALMGGASPAAAARVVDLDSRFVKLDAKGNAVADNAKKWAAVLDNSTGLIWSAENVGKGEMNHAAAIKACDELELAGHSDWRLPTIRELQSLVAFERHEPAIEIAFFPTCRSSWYWSSTITAWSSDYAWFVAFSGGLSLSLRRGSLIAFVRAVRSVPASQ